MLCPGPATTSYDPRKGLISAIIHMVLCVIQIVYFRRGPPEKKTILNISFES
jgi:hypothetical protein